MILANLNQMARDMEKFFEAPYAGHYPSKLEGFPVDIYENEKGDKYFLEIEVPGFSRDNIDLKVDGDKLIILAKRERESSKEDRKLLRFERKVGLVERIFRAPYQIDPDHVQAKLVDGVLEVQIQKRPSPEERKILIT